MLQTHPEEYPLEALATDDRESGVCSTEILSSVSAAVPPLWPLPDFVAVNPFVGLSHHRFLDARRLLTDVRNCELLPSLEYFRSLIERGEVEQPDVISALQRCAEEYPEWYADRDVDSFIQQVTAAETAEPSAERRFFTASEAIDHLTGGNWTSHIINDITRHCAAHYDEGQALWTNPWRDLPLYEAWRDAAQRSRRMDMLGITGFRGLVIGLPGKPADAIARLLELLGIPERHWQSFLLCELHSVAGWASFVKYRERDTGGEGLDNDDLMGLLAMRLAYDAALMQCHGFPPLDLYPNDESEFDGWDLEPPAVSEETLTRYLLQVASEAAYQRQLQSVLGRQVRPARPTGRKSLQMVFCIDVRSELMRRHLEAVDASIETFGFAGFFGMALEYVRLGESSGTPQCPVLLQPAFRVQEHVLGGTKENEANTIQRRWRQRTARKVWKRFQTFAASCFSFVETVGLLFSVKLLAQSFFASRPVPAADHDGLPMQNPLPLGPALDDAVLPLEKQADLAEGMLRNLGLTSEFARVVSLCGHTADVVNNPYQASLACGACGGHSGEPNARVAAALLNDPRVREELARRGTVVPSDTWFVAAVHNTTTDEIRYPDGQAVPEAHRDVFRQVRGWVQEASERSRTERATRLGTSRSADVFRRCRDWAEVRPEWGLAGNAALIVAPRSRTQGLDLQGRTFMHSYDYRRDPDSKVLELIMTAPMVVANWINLQYYASTVDNRSFGSGNKLIHNVVGQFGVLQGNGGDLQTGLPWQSLHDGVHFQHAPLRLSVLIEAHRDAVEDIIRKHATVRDLASNGWLTVIVMEEHDWYRWTSGGEWELEPSPAESREEDAADTALFIGSRMRSRHSKWEELSSCQSPSIP